MGSPIRPIVAFPVVVLVVAASIYYELLSKPEKAGQEHEGADSDPRAFIWSDRHQIWTLSTKSVTSEKVQQPCVWPEDCPASDRIVEQLLLSEAKSDKIFKIATSPNHIDVEEQDRFIRENCRVNRCSTTINFEEADAIVLQNADVPPGIPKHRRADQVWIAYLLESPPNTFDERFPRAHRGKHEFNWTATYRSDSDIVTPYAKFLPFESTVDTYLRLGAHHTVELYWKHASQVHKKLIQEKQGRVAWFVSNCHAKNSRLQVARELAKFIPVDVYGKCGDHSCDKHNQSECLQMINWRYKFYLAFENSNNREYITEKLYRNALDYNAPDHLVLPIVMGPTREDYEKFAPRGSFIHVDDFKTIESLGKFLISLDSNDALYYSYFQWKRLGDFIDTKFMCRVCAMLHDAAITKKSKSYRDIISWWRQE